MRNALVREAIAFERAHQRWTRDEVEKENAPLLWNDFQIWDPVPFVPEHIYDFCPVPFEATY